MTPLYPYKAQGRTLSQVHLANHVPWKTLATKTRVPPSNKLLNFDLVAGRGKTAKTFLVLDPYGMETLSLRMNERFFGHGTREEGFTLAIDRATGELLTAHFKTERVKGKRITTVVLVQLTWYRSGDGESVFRLPTKYLKRIDELKSKKRPFDFTCFDDTMWAFIDQEASLEDLRQNLVVEFDFDRRRLQLWQDAHREVTRWV